MTCRTACLTLLLLGPLTAAHGQLLILEQNGLFAGESTLGGEVIPNGTPFTLRAVFDSQLDLNGSEEQGVFDTVVTFDIDGLGVFTSDPAGDVFASIREPGLDSSTYSGSIQVFVGNSGVQASYSSATPLYDADMPTPTVMSNFVGTDDGLPFIVPLVGGAGDLVFNGSPFSSITVTRILPIPEPASLALLSLCAAALAARRRASDQ